MQPFALILPTHPHYDVQLSTRSLCLINLFQKEPLNNGNTGPYLIEKLFSLRSVYHYIGRATLFFKCMLEVNSLNTWSYFQWSYEISSSKFGGCTHLFCVLYSECPCHLGTNTGLIVTMYNYYRLVLRTLNWYQTRTVMMTLKSPLTPMDQDK